MPSGQDLACVNAQQEGAGLSLHCPSERAWHTSTQSQEHLDGALKQKTRQPLPVIVSVTGPAEKRGKVKSEFGPIYGSHLMVLLSQGLYWEGNYLG